MQALGVELGAPPWGALWAGKFDPDEAEIGRILDNFERLAKKWAASRANQRLHPNASDQYGTATALGGCLPPSER